MIDLHNHILPMLDDGARDLEESLLMAKLAIEAGTTVMVATPHRFYRSGEIVPDTIVDRAAALQAEFDVRNVPLRILPGSEIPIALDIPDKLIDGRLLRLGGRSGTHALIETPFEQIQPFSLKVIESVIDAGIGVVLAHPERNVQVQQDLAFAESCAGLGAVLQITSGSIMGHFGPLAEAAARAIVLRTDWAILIASDAHWAHDRTPAHIGAAAERVAEWIGDPARARSMVTDVPAACLGLG